MITRHWHVAALATGTRPYLQNFHAHHDFFDNVEYCNGIGLQVR
jgi:hypothetical protein